MVSGKLGKVRTIYVEKQSYAPAADVTAKNKGLKYKVGEAEIYTAKDLGKLKNWEEQVATDYKAVNKAFDYKNPSVAVFEGYIDVPEDGVYEFSSNMDELYIGGKLLIDNDGEVKRHPRTNRSIALAKGLHAVKFVYINNVYGGWPQAWNGVRISFKNVNEKRFKELRPQHFLHE